MKTATPATAVRPTITSTVGVLSDRALLRQTSTLVRHERHLQGAIIDHLAEIEARRLYLRRGCSSLFDYAVRELGYSDAAAGRRIGAVRLCADQPDARERLRDGSLTLSAAAELQWAFDRQRRRGSIAGIASSAPPIAAAAGDGVPGSAPTEAPAPAGGALGSAAAKVASADDPVAGEPAPPLVLDAAGRQKLVEEAAGKSARQVRRMLADLDPELAPPADRVRPLGEGRYELKAVIDTDCQQGLEHPAGVALACGPTHDRGAAPRPHRAGGARPPRPEPAAASSAQQPGGAGRIPARFGSEGAGRAGFRSRRHGAGPGDPRRHHSGAGADATPDADFRAVADPPAGDAPTSRCGDEACRRHHFDAEAVRFGPRDSGGGTTAGVAAGRWPLQLPRSADRPPLQLTTPDRDRPHPALCAWRWCRSRESPIVMRSPPPSSARAARLNGAFRGISPEATTVAPPSVSAPREILNTLAYNEQGATGNISMELALHEAETRLLSNS